MKVLILNQAFYPDVVSTAQHASDLAASLAEAGHQVTVVANGRGYDDPSVRFAHRETWKKVRILRVSATGFGKGARWRRATDFATFMASCALRVLLLGRFDVVVAMTSPPLISFLAALLVPLKARRLVFWSMDLNPDEALAAGWLRQGSLTSRFLSRLLRYSLRRADAIVALDRFMLERIRAKGIAGDKVAVLPPWSHDDCVRFDPEARARFRARHGLDGKFVVMYSGNHSPCHPLDTLQEAARRLAEHPEIVFLFIGGGSEYRRLQAVAREERLPNLRFLPYQPQEELAGSLSAADLHVVVMGDGFVGIVHPCKIYNVLAVGAPFLYIGPLQSHIGDVVTRLQGKGRAHVAGHGEVEKVVESILQAGQGAVPDRVHAHEFASQFSRQVLIPKMIQVLQPADSEVPASAAVSKAPESRNPL